MDGVEVQKPVKAKETAKAGVLGDVAVVNRPYQIVKESPTVCWLMH